MYSFSVIIPASGFGERFKSSIPKQYVLIHEKPLINYTIDTFIDFFKKSRYNLNEIVIAYDKKSHNSIKNSIENLNFFSIKLIEGGNYRHISIYNCLKYLNTKYLGVEHNHYVLIHDAVRPIVDFELIENLLSNCLEHGACGPICNLTSTILNVDNEGFLNYALNRSKFRASEMPQVFKLNIILKAYNSANEDDLFFGTECLDLVKKYTNNKVKLIEGDPNILFKVTYKKDYFSALNMIKKKIKFRTLVLSKKNDKNFLNEFNSNLTNYTLKNDSNIEYADLTNFHKIQLDILFVFFFTNDYNKILDIILNNNYNYLIIIIANEDLNIKNNNIFTNLKNKILIKTKENFPIYSFIEKINSVCNNLPTMNNIYLEF